VMRRREHRATSKDAGGGGQVPGGRRQEVGSRLLTITEYWVLSTGYFE
jgi:hypothetical protein